MNTVVPNVVTPISNFLGWLVSDPIEQKLA